MDGVLLGGRVVIAELPYPLDERSVRIGAGVCKRNRVRVNGISEARRRQCVGTVVDPRTELVCAHVSEGGASHTSVWGTGVIEETRTSIEICRCPTQDK